MVKYNKLNTYINESIKMRDTPLCLYPFYHQLVRPDGTGMPCCSFNESKNFLSNIHHSEFFHSKWMDDLRAGMWEDTVPGGCKSCIAGEEAGGVSNRSISFWKAKNIGFDFNTQPPTLLGQELNVSNLCNLRCRMCDSSRSSKWIAEDLAYNRPTARLQQSGWVLSAEEAKTIKFLTFLGGEPMLHQDCMITSLNEVKKHNRLAEVGIYINSNMVTRLENELVELMTECEYVDFNASIDGYGPMNDYIRSDSKWEILTENLLYLDSMCGEYKNFRWQPINTVTVLNCNKMHELYEWLAITFTHSDQPSSAILAIEPWHMAVNNLPDDVKEILRVQLTDLKNLSTRKHLQRQGVFSKWVWDTHYKSLYNYVSMQPASYPTDLDWKEEFWRFTNFLDNGRGTKFSDVNPEMAEWLKI
tara:strand:- start:570 stop:1814 length:1245 start_codon:yes stop_codon:yes gene_type:complete